MFWHLTEGILAFSKEDLEKEYNKESYKVAHIYMDGKGIVHLGYYGKDPNNLATIFSRTAEVTLWPDEKKISVRRTSFGRISPRLDQLIKTLKSNGIVDDSWHLDARGLGGIGYYKDGKYVTEPEEINKSPLSKLRRLDKSITDLVAYHGTSEEDWQKIQKFGGLSPLFMSSGTTGGYESRYKHEYNKKTLYLAGTMQKAWDYATTRAKQISTKNGQKYGSSPCDLLVKPIVLRVNIPDITKLRSDDDAVNSIMSKWARRIWDKFSYEEKKDLIKKMSDERGFDVSSMPDYIWRETDAGFAKLLSLLPKDAFQAWFASAKRTGQIGYRGVIPLRFLQNLDLCS